MSDREYEVAASELRQLARELRRMARRFGAERESEFMNAAEEWEQLAAAVALETCGAVAS